MFLSVLPLHVFILYNCSWDTSRPKGITIRFRFEIKFCKLMEGKSSVTWASHNNNGHRPRCCSSRNCQWGWLWRRSAGPPAADWQTVSAAPGGSLWPAEKKEKPSYMSQRQTLHLWLQPTVQELTLAPGFSLSSRHPNSSGPKLNSASAQKYTILCLRTWNKYINALWLLHWWTWIWSKSNKMMLTLPLNSGVNSRVWSRELR